MFIIFICEFLVLNNEYQYWHLELSVWLDSKLRKFLNDLCSRLIKLT